MKLLRDCWAALLELFNVVTFSPNLQPSSQQVLPGNLGADLNHVASGGPVFSPPSRPQDPDSLLKCDYSPMGNQWQPCSTNHSRECWLAGPGGQQFDILTDYEKKTPIGITRKVSAVSWHSAMAFS